MTVIVDYGRGNIYSISAALRHCGADAVVTDDPSAVRDAGRIVLPGVGAFGDAARSLRDRGLWEPIVRHVKQGKPMLGICVGMQLLASRGTEFGDHAGLDLVDGVVQRLPDCVPGPDGVRLPNVGWRPLEIHRPHPVTMGQPDGSMMYFVHSFALTCRDKADVCASIKCNGTDATAIVTKGSVVGCQFHPERSGPAGLKLLESFLAWSP